MATPYGRGVDKLRVFTRKLKKRWLVHRFERSNYLFILEKLLEELLADHLIGRNFIINQRVAAVFNAPGIGVSACPYRCFSVAISVFQRG